MLRMFIRLRLKPWYLKQAIRNQNRIKAIMEGMAFATT